MHTCVTALCTEFMNKTKWISSRIVYAYYWCIFASLFAVAHIESYAIKKYPKCSDPPAVPNEEKDQTNKSETSKNSEMKTINVLRRSHIFSCQSNCYKARARLDYRRYHNQTIYTIHKRIAMIKWPKIKYFQVKKVSSFSKSIPIH